MGHPQHGWLRKETYRRQVFCSGRPGDTFRSFGNNGAAHFEDRLLVTPPRNPENLAIRVFPVAFRVFPSETARKSFHGDLVTYASNGFGEEWLHHNS